MSDSPSGRISVRVFPDTSKMRTELKTALERIEKNVTGKVNFEANSKGLLNQVRTTIKQAESMAKISAHIRAETAVFTSEVKKAVNGAADSVEVKLNLADAAFKERIRSSVEKAVAGIDAKVPATVEGEHLRRELGAKISQLEKQLSLDIPADVERGAQWRAGIEKLKKDIDDLQATVNADADTGKARTKLAILTRPRLAHINIKLNGLGVASSALAALAGGNVLHSLGSKIKDLALNFDKVAVKAGSVATSVALIGSAASSAIGSVATLATSFAQMAPAALALPGIITAFGVGIAGSLDGLQNINVYMREASEAAGEFWSTWYDESGKAHRSGYDIVEEFKNARFEGGKNFWAEASKSLLALRDNLFIPFFNEYRGMMSNLGVWWGKFFDGISSGLQKVGGMGALFAPLNEAIKISVSGVKPLVEGIVQLGLVGGKYLPRMAESFNRLAGSFSSWVSQATESGEIFTWIDAALANIRALGSALGSIGGIIGAISSAAAAAGSGGIGALAEGLDRIEATVSGPAFQTALTTIFQGAYAGVSALAPGVRALGGAFEKLAPVISGAMETAGEAVSLLLEGLGSALADPAFGAGLSQLFDGIKVAAEALSPALGELGPLFGALAGTFGTLLRTLGPVVAQLIDRLAPVFTDLLDGLQPVIEAIGEKLVSALDAVLPVILPVVQAVVDFIAQNPELAATILLIVAAVGAFIAGLLALVSAVAPVVAGIGTVITTVAGVLGVATAVAAGWIAAIVAIIAAVIALVVAIVANWDAIKEWTASTWESIKSWTASAWESIVSFITDAVSAVVDRIQTTWGDLVDLVSEIWQSVSTAITDAFNGIVEFLTPILNAIFESISTAVDNIVAFWAEAWNLLAEPVSAVWELIKAIVGGALRILYEIFAGIVRTIVGVWNQAWQAIADFVGPIFEQISSVVTDVLTAIRDFISETLTKISVFFTDTWNNVYSTVSDVVDSIWNAVSTAFHSMLDAVSGIVNSIWETITTAFNNILSTIRDSVNTALETVRRVFGEMVSAVSTKIGEVVSTVGELPGKVLNALGNMGSLLVESGKSLIGGFIEGIKGMTGSVTGAVDGLVQKVRDFFPFSPAKRGPFSGTGYTTYSGRALTSDFAAAMKSQVNKVKAAGEAVANAAYFDAPAINYAANLAAATAPITAATGPTSSPTGHEETDLAEILIALASTLNRLEEVDPRSFMMMKRRAERIA
ncbi:hypothetical protein [Rothia sp. P4278]|uniref:hypothetical protein n=1 Tax=Rothia sp. P4278 TaxID=3402658 RepID=UPI003AE6C5E6